MADGPQYIVPLRRRREERTDYEKRLRLLKSGEHRAVIRLSNRHARVQITAYSPSGDETVTGASSEHLEGYGWTHHPGNIPAAYLTGFLAGKRARDAGVNGAVVDLGVFTPEYRGRHYAVVQGLQDAGLDVPADGSVFPAEERVAGAHAAAYESDGIDDAVETVRAAIVDEYGDDA